MIATTSVLQKLTVLKDQVLGDTRKAAKDVTKGSQEALQLKGLAMHALKQRRHGAMKYDLNPAFWALCNPPKKEHELLFGTKLQERVRDQNEAHNVGLQVKDKRGYNSGPYRTSRGSRQSGHYDRSHSSGQGGHSRYQGYQQ